MHKIIHIAKFANFDEIIIFGKMLHAKQMDHPVKIIATEKMTEVRKFLHMDKVKHFGDITKIV